MVVSIFFSIIPIKVILGTQQPKGSGLRLSSWGFGHLQASILKPFVLKAEGLGLGVESFEFAVQGFKV